MNDLRGHVLVIIAADRLSATEQLRLQEQADLVIDNLEHGGPSVVKDRIRLEGPVSRYDVLGRVADHLVQLEEEAS